VKLEWQFLPKVIIYGGNGWLYIVPINSYQIKVVRGGVLKMRAGPC